jgi:hypothetical protein
MCPRAWSYRCDARGAIAVGTGERVRAERRALMRTDSKELF